MMQAASPTTFRDFTLELATEVVEEFRGQPGALIVALHKLQETFGYVDEAAMPMLARLFNLSRAEVHGVISFYHYFRSTPPGHHTIHLCRAEACQSMGCERLVERAESRLGIECGNTSADGRVTLEAVYCLGLCATAPSAMIDGRVIGRLDAGRLDELLREAQA